MQTRVSDPKSMTYVGTVLASLTSEKAFNILSQVMMHLGDTGLTKSAKNAMYEYSSIDVCFQHLGSVTYALVLPILGC
jgi:hypothetical protein